MDLVLEIEGKNLQKVKDALGGDDIVSRASITYRDGSIIGKNCTMCHVAGTEEQISKAKELVKDFAKESNEGDTKKFIEKIREEEGSANEGMGMIFS